MSDGESNELPQLAATARLFGRLFVRELDRQTLAEMQQPELRTALAMYRSAESRQWEKVWD